MLTISATGWFLRGGCGDGVRGTDIYWELTPGKGGEEVGCAEENTEL